MQQDVGGGGGHPIQGRQNTAQCPATRWIPLGGLHPRGAAGPGPYMRHPPAPPPPPQF